MSTLTAGDISNPYASPLPIDEPAPVVAAPPAKPGSLMVILGGFFLVLVGYLASNFFLISDLYGVGFGPGGKVIPSPLAEAFGTPALQWLIYAAFASAFVAGAVMIGSQTFNPLAGVAYVMCPIVSIIFLLGWPLRVARAYAEQVAAVYLLIGSCLAFTGATRLFLLYGRGGGDFAPVAASMTTEAGLALIVGAIVKFWLAASPASAMAAEPVVVATPIDSFAAR